MGQVVGGVHLGRRNSYQAVVGRHGRAIGGAKAEEGEMARRRRKRAGEGEEEGGGFESPRVGQCHCHKRSIPNSPSQKAL